VRPYRCGSGQRFRSKVRWYYVADMTQILVAALIVANFVANICEAQINETPGTRRVFDTIDLFFTSLFACELAINLFATLVVEFVFDAWNWFDVVVVTVSLLSLGFENLPGANVLRLLRCFRVFRLFKRIPSLTKIVSAVRSHLNLCLLVIGLPRLVLCSVLCFFADLNMPFQLTMSLGPMANAFSIVCLVNAIYAIIGTLMVLHGATKFQTAAWLV
jgi:hypothetical protein